MPTTEAVKDIVVKIMVELLEIFAILTSKIQRGRASELIPGHMFPVVDRGSERCGETETPSASSMKYR